MEITIIVIVLLIIGVFIWRSYVNNKKQDPHKGSNPNPNAPTSSKRL